MTTPFSNQPGRTKEQASAYVASILAKLGDRDPLEVQEGTPAALRRLVAGLSAEQLERPEAPGKWSVAQVVRHLADAEVAAAWRLRLAIAQDRPQLTGFDQNAWIERAGGAYPTVEDAIAFHEALRRANLALLRSLAPADWERVGMHVERGPESVALMAKLYAGHDLVHRAQIERIRTTVMK